MPLNPLQSLFAAVAQGFPILIDAAIKGFVILALAGALTILMRRSSSAMRHLIWAGAVAGALAAPALSALLPEWRVLPGWTSGETANAAPSTSAPNAYAAPAAAEQSNESAAPMVLSQPVHSSTASDPSRASTGAAAAKASLNDWPAKLQWREWAMMIWLAGACVLLAPMIIGVFSLRRIQRRARRIESGEWPELLRELSEGLGMRRKVTLLEGADSMMPMTWGVLRPTILLPATATAWPPERKRAVLAHELAHVMRWDCLTQMLAQAARAIYWFNPLSWLAARRLAAERERACDDLVLMCGARASDYAEHLLILATGLRSDTILSAAAIAMARPSRLEGRLLAILDKNRNRQALTRIATILAIAIIAACVVPLSVLQAAKEPATHPATTPAEWAMQRGWRARDIKKTTLESFWGGWRNLPFEISKEEEADARACFKLADDINRRHNGQSFLENKAQSVFDHDETRAALEKILKGRPDYFYAQFILATWYRRQGNLEKSAQLFESAWIHAPVVIVQRFELPDGKPLANAEIRSFALECNRVRSGSLDPSLKLYYPDLKTDASGCIYLAAYNTVFRTDEMSSPQGYKPQWATLGWFESPAKVGLLPVCLATPELSAADVSAAEEALKKMGAATWREYGAWRSDKSAVAVYLANPKVTDAAFIHLKKLPELRSLRMTPDTAITDSALTDLDHLPNLEELALPFGKITDHDLGNIHRLIRLRRLDLWGTRITDEGLGYLQGMSDLEWLDLRTTRITDAGLAKIANLTNLKHLNLSHTRITDAGLQHLKGLRHLEFLDVSETRVSPAGLIMRDEMLRGGKSVSVTGGAVLPSAEKPTSVTQDVPTSPNSRPGLEFRIVPNGAGSSRTPLYPLFVGEGTDKATTESFGKKALQELAEKGPQSAWTGGDDLVWIELACKFQRSDALVGEYQGREYVLLCNRAPYVMIIGATGGKNGNLRRVTAEKDGPSPSVAIEFDDVAGDSLAVLTNMNLQNNMAIVVAGKAISAPAIMARLQNQVRITGSFTPKEVDQLAAAIRAGMQSADGDISSSK